jgi:hypothetical protein
LKNVADERPILVCRLECPPQMQEGVDEWMPKHFDDSLDHDAVTSAVSYRIQQDFSPADGLPWLFNGHGNRFIVYVADGIDGLLDWIDSPILREAIDDGVDRETAYPFLDGDQFTGNIYEVSSALSPIGEDFPGETRFIAERFEVGDDDIEAFDEWLEREYAPAWAQIDSVIRVRTYRQRRDLPERFPFLRYMSKGNRMVFIELPMETDLPQFVKQDEVRQLLETSLPWDLRLPYVRRELGECIALRDKEDAAATYDERRKTTV